jgi:hypothetical protein
MSDTTASIWLAVIALSVLTQTLLFIGAAILVHRRTSAMERRLHVLERDTLVPLLARIELALGDAQDAIARVRRADDEIRQAWDRTKRTTGDLLRRASARSWPVWGVVKGVRAAASTLARANGSMRDRAQPHGVLENTLFEEEGGHVDVRS